MSTEPASLLSAKNRAGGLLCVSEGLVLVERTPGGLVIPGGTWNSQDVHLGKTAARGLFEETGYTARMSAYLGQVPGGELDVFLMHGAGESDPSVEPQSKVAIVGLGTEFKEVMRHPSEADFVAAHLATLLRAQLSLSADRADELGLGKHALLQQSGEGVGVGVRV